MRHLTVILILGKLIDWSLLSAAADWPMLRGSPSHSGFVTAELAPPFRPAWAREIDGERIGTAVEPIVTGGKVFAGTHAGNLYALSAVTGEVQWRFQAHGPFLHSPAAAEGVVVAACADGQLYAVELETGKLAWRFDVGPGGFSAAPVIDRQHVYIGSRAGDFLSVRLKDGQLGWRQSTGAPVRQTAAVADGKVYVMSEDLRVRSFDAEDGQLAWTSRQLTGQTGRDYYPVMVRQGEHRFLVVRTNPILNMGQRIGRDRTFLCRTAGVDDSNWKLVDAWIKSPQARGTPELWAGEQTAIVNYLDANRDARTFFVLDPETGNETITAPVLWIAGCQAVGAQPAVTADGRLLVFYRSAYGNWNHGVAPLVTLGLLDLSANKMAPLFHQQGVQPHWNCFWGTADESQNFVVAGSTLFIVHQGTLSGFDLRRNQLFPIRGERDTYGGFRNPPWARNEWHGPGRGGIALAGNRIYWQTGSRILCLTAGDSARPAGEIKPVAIGEPGQHQTAPAPASRSVEEVRRELARRATDIMSRNWAPLFCDPGLAGREFSFDDSGELFEAIAWAWPHLPPALQAQARERLRREWHDHPPFALQAHYALQAGDRREWFWVPTEYCGRLGGDRLPHPFANLAVARFYAERCGEAALLREAWPRFQAVFDEFIKSGWRLNSAKGDLFANRYLSSLQAMATLAAQNGDSLRAQQARTKAEETTGALLGWWRRAGEQGTLKTFNTSSELDPFIGKGDGLSLALAPHRHKLGLFHGLTPEIATLVRAHASDAVTQVWAAFSMLCPTWFVVGEERQIHFGENFVDPPDFAHDSFKAFAWLKKPSRLVLARHVDLPFSKADLYHLTKLALVLESN